MKHLYIAISLVLYLSTARAQAADNDLGTALKQEYAGKTLILRHALERGSQRYDASGKLLSGGREGTWTLYGGMNVEKVSVTANRLLLEGRRARFLYDASKGGLTPVVEKGPSLKVEVLLQRPCASLEEAVSIIDRVFATRAEDLVNSVPNYWKPFVAKQAGLTWEEADSGVPVPELGSGIDGPKPMYTPEPEFTEEVLQRKLEGLIREFHGKVVLSAIIDAKGKVQQPRIVRPLGMGLDEKAIETMKSWQFKPARKNGQAVSVKMVLEVEFNFT